MIRELTSRGAAVLLIAHSLTDVSMCDEVWVMSEGKIVEMGVPEELIKRESGLFNFMNSKSKWFSGIRWGLNSFHILQKKLLKYFFNVKLIRSCRTHRILIIEYVYLAKCRTWKIHLYNLLTESCRIILSIIYLFRFLNYIFSIFAILNSDKLDSDKNIFCFLVCPVITRNLFFYFFTINYKNLFYIIPDTVFSWFS